ncbi:MarR family winged helix-turn-helix transcriptional regulator [Ktedonospora formicarum]|uniref:HTH marR-type domain-containing protein n=1 Tax=Ktedonospora formicarum TaxID=2778364 RepID=A0A8J3MWU0_9CHLR|nr:MarR family transcriptional regulator [Ktedonospora formicarum]GHO49331.1 hypothetical protein KSX_74940 [Ktedonospora formicarum]
MLPFNSEAQLTKSVQSEREQMEEEALNRYLEIHRALWRSLAETWMSLDLSLAQLRTLLLLANHGSLPVSQLARHMEIGVPTAGHLIEKLVQAGFVERSSDATDRRRCLVRLTQQGEELYTRLLVGRYTIAASLRHLSDEELAAYHMGANALANSLRSQLVHGHEV